jgi:hypothetical protein
MVADVFALSAFPKAKMLLLRKYPMILVLEILLFNRALNAASRRTMLCARGDLAI